MNKLIETLKSYFDKFNKSRANTPTQSVFNIGYLIGKNILIFTLLAFVLVGFFVAGIGIGYFANIISHTDIPSETVMKVKIGQLNQASSLHFSDGSLIAEVRSDITRKIVNSEDISDFVKQGLIATEDGLFYQHSGIVPKSAFRAVLQELTGSSTQTGGSTLTQQLVKQQLLSNEVTFARKAKEMLLALRVEKFFTKEEILTAYLNVSPFGRNSSGQNIAGIETAAQGIFGVSAKDVTLNQAAFLVGLPQSPYYYTPYTNTGAKKTDVSLGIGRMKIVLNAMHREGYITSEQLSTALNYDITKDFIAPTSHGSDRQNFLYQAVNREAIIILMKQQIEADGKKWEEVNTSETVELYNSYYRQAANLLSSGGYRVYSTIDKNLYNEMQKNTFKNIGIIDRSYDTRYKDAKTGETKTVTELPQVGQIVIENATGKILGFVGGTNFENSQMDHVFMARRSPGSTIKPLLVYAPAIEAKFAYPATLLADFPITRSQPDGSVWKPTNASGAVSNQFVTFRETAVQSLNNPTIHLYSAMLANNINTGEYMQKMGVHGIPLNEYKNEAASVGGFSGGPTVAEQTAAFTTFANNGQYIENYLIEKIEDNNGNIIYQHTSKTTPVFNEGTAFIMRSILSDSVTRGTTRHFKNHINFSLPATYGKTGTSDYYRDLWTIISTPKVTIGQWVGFDNNYGAVHNLTINNSHGHVAIRTQQYFAYTLNDIHAARPDFFANNLQFSGQPSNVVTQSVLRSTGTAPGTVDVNGTQVSINGEMTSDLFLRDRGPFPLNYYFSPGAGDTILNTFWNSVIPPAQPETSEATSGEGTEEAPTEQSAQPAQTEEKDD